jgi:signal-induced proliferation-associated 1 like protein 3
VPLVPLVPDVPELPLMPEPLVPPLMPPVPPVPLLPLMPLVPLVPPLMPLLLPLVPDWLLPEEVGCFLLFFLVCFFSVGVVVVPVAWSPCMPLAPLCWLPMLELWPEALCPVVLPVCACTFREVNIAATTETPSSAFNTLLIFMSIS